jgi:hypothetical protein
MLHANERKIRIIFVAQQQRQIYGFNVVLFTVPQQMQVCTNLRNKGLLEMQRNAVCTLVSCSARTDETLQPHVCAMSNLNPPI